MRSPHACLFATIVAAVTALPASTLHSVHEKRSTPSWTKVDGAKPNGGIVLPIRVGLAQSNLEHGYDLLMDVANPKSPGYGKHWTVDKVIPDIEHWQIRKSLPDL